MEGGSLSATIRKHCCEPFCNNRILFPYHKVLHKPVLLAMLASFACSVKKCTIRNVKQLVKIMGISQLFWDPELLYSNLRTRIFWGGGGREGGIISGNPDAIFLFGIMICAGKGMRKKADGPSSDPFLAYVMYHGCYKLLKPWLINQGLQVLLVTEN